MSWDVAPQRTRVVALPGLLQSKYKELVCVVGRIYQTVLSTGICFASTLLSKMCYRQDLPDIAVN
jgi:hypothetical protein